MILERQHLSHKHNQILRHNSQHIKNLISKSRSNQMEACGWFHITKLYLNAQLLQLFSNKLPQAIERSLSLKGDSVAATCVQGLLF